MMDRIDFGLNFKSYREDLSPDKLIWKNKIYVAYPNIVERRLALMMIMTMMTIGYLNLKPTIIWVQKFLGVLQLNRPDLANPDLHTPSVAGATLKSWLKHHYKAFNEKL